MKKCSDIAAALAEEYTEKACLHNLPSLSIAQALFDEREAFAATCMGGQLTLSAASPLGQVFGLSTLTLAAQGGHLADFLSLQRPRFALRPLWLKADCQVAITEHVSIFLPEFLLAADRPFTLPRFCRRLLECGFNSLLLGSHYGAFSSSPASRLDELEPVFAELAAHGINTIIKPSFYLAAHGKRHPRCPYNKQFAHHLIKACADLWLKVPSCHAMFWESMVHFSNYRHHPKAQEATEAEVVLEEIKLLEQCVDSKQLIFYLPAPDLPAAQKQASWLPALLDDMGNKTTLAFSAVCGHHDQDHQPPHPLWDELRLSPDSSSTPLMPILNVGLVNSGEGLWPTHNFDLIQRYIARCRRHHFSGVISTVNHQPAPGSLLDCLLWVAGQSLWSDLPPELLAQTWLNVHLPSIDVDSWLHTLELGRKVALQAKSLHAMACQSQTVTAEEGAILIESLVGNVKLMRWHAHTPSKKGLALATFDVWRMAVDYFTADIYQLAENFAQFYHLPAFTLPEHEELCSPLWVCPSHKNLPPAAWIAAKPQGGVLSPTAEELLSTNRHFE